MKFRVLVSALALSAAVVRAQTPEAAAKLGSVEGTVVNSATGEPIKKASIWLNPPPGRDARARMPIQTMSDANGRFHFDSVEPGLYTVNAQRDAYMETQGLWGIPAPFQVAEEQKVKDVVVRLVPLAVASGHVLDEGGEPIARALVAVLRYFYAPAGRQLRPVARVLTNDLGEFEVLNLQPGRYYFHAVGPRMRNLPAHIRWTRPEEAYPITFYPNAREIGEATATDVAAGERVSGIDFRLRKVPAYHIRGVVAEPAGPAVNFQRVSVDTPGTHFGAIFDSHVAPDGSFDIAGVAAGSYELSYTRAVAGRTDEAYPAHSVNVDGGDINGVVFERKPDVNVSGTIAIEDGRLDQLHVYVALNPTKGVFSAGAGPAQDGSFLITSAPIEICSLDLRSLPEGYYVKSIHYGEREIKDGLIDLTNGASAPLKIVLASDGGTIEGSVQTEDGKAAAGAEVTVAPPEEYGGRPDLLKTATTDAAGHFHVRDVAPGDYRVYAWETDLDQSTKSAEFRKLFEGKSAEVTVGPKGAASVQVNLISADEIAKGRSKLP